MAPLNFRETIGILRDKLSETLPGQRAHKVLEPAYRRDLQRSPGKDCKLSAVLILLYPTPTGNICFPLTLRQPHLGHHSNQISLPGGKVAEGDPDLQCTALRETFEEIGIHSSQITVIGKLSPVFIPPTNFLVYPFVGYMNHAPAFQPQVGEVAAIFEANPYELLKSGNIIFRPHIFNDRKYEVGGYKIAGHSVWGATGMILTELKILLNIN